MYAFERSSWCSDSARPSAPARLPEYDVDLGAAAREHPSGVQRPGEAWRGVQRPVVASRGVASRRVAS
ncbi:hypothetical protein, partial [Enhygromyxa salina]|uniref:hypothetical protein n=1 Tax=Enhygromyxa salina TaxID=215803 RepID=UPI001969D8DA